MIEGQIRRADLGERGDTADLRRFRWTDLVARLAATRELREEIDRLEGGFTAFADVRREGGEKHEDAINHDVSTDGKLDALGPGGTAGDATSGERETE
ncbi:hypothetical protein P8Q88_08125 [Qipengyuania sp. XHP0207]|uniref:hypothetical protein n=1 Tax=Qipengyuania sp. XHP0207 TaxID=3038078 RepID=UPI00241EB819|nr:hypothetical protein [Qipengyuania sp. XHP0207]MDG5748147.1 hypothetical protein [Qipengyuania sp. XHP0207]